MTKRYFEIRHNQTIQDGKVLLNECQIILRKKKGEHSGEFSITPEETEILIKKLIELLK